MLNLTYFVVRVSGTHNYLPNLPPGKVRGHSFQEFQFRGGEFGPRLFHSQRAARAALAQWKRGKHRLKTAHSLRPFELDETVEVTPVPGRESVQAEIVPVVLALAC